MIVTCQCKQHSVDMQLTHIKLSNAVKRHTIFEKSATNPKYCKILSTFHWQFQLRWLGMSIKNITHNLWIVDNVSIMDKLFLGSIKPKVHIRGWFPIHSLIFHSHCLGFLDADWEYLLQVFVDIFN